jgi:hypothetical protein
MLKHMSRERDTPLFSLLGEQFAFYFWLVSIFQHPLQVCACHRIRHVNADPHIGVAEYLQSKMLELQAPRCCMLHDLVARKFARCIVLLLPPTKLRADLFEGLNQFFKCWSFRWSSRHLPTGCATRLRRS